MEDQTMNKASACGSFGRYFSYDLRRTWYSCGFSALCVGILPLIGYFVAFLFHIAGLPNSMPSVEITKVFVPICICIYVLMFPAKLYGDITDRRAGANYLMLPASTGAKFASMLLILLLVIPISLFVLFCVSDLLLSLMPGYGQGLTSTLFLEDFSELHRGQFFGKGMILSDNLIATTSLEQLFNFILFFTLGSLIFKKKKTGKTILSYIAITATLVLICFCIANLFFKDFRTFSLEMSETATIILCNGINLAVGALLAFFIYRRLKKIEL